MGSRITYRQKAGFYEYDYPTNVDHEFVCGLIGPDTNNVLEIPCGIGRLTIPLSDHEVRICAVDKEVAMIERLNRKLLHAHISNVETQVGDIRTLKLNRLFDLILVPQEAIQLIARNELVPALRCLRAHMDKTSVLMIDTFEFAHANELFAGSICPDYYTAGLKDGEEVFDWVRRTSQTTELERYHRQFHNRDGVRIQFRYIEKKPSGVQEFEMEVRFCTYAPFEFRDALSQADLRITSVLHYYHQLERSDKSNRNIYLLVRN